MKKNIDTIIKEAIDRVLRESVNDYTTWVRIGEVSYSPYMGRDKSYIVSNPSNPTQCAYQLTDTEFQSINSLPSFVKDKAIIYDEYKNSPCSIPFLGSMNMEEKEEKHKDFLSRLNIVNGKVCLKHNSRILINDGMLSMGHPKNNYSNNSDLGWYSWASTNAGQDPSNGKKYTYIAFIDPSELYDMDADLKRYGNIRKAVANEPYVGKSWDDGSGAICVCSYTATPIDIIMDNSSGKQYDGNWERIK